MASTSAGMRRSSAPPAGRQIQHGLPAVSEDQPHEVQRGDQVGKGRGDSRAQNLIARRQQAEHEQRIEPDVHHAPQGDSKARLAGPSLRAHQVAQQRVQRRGHAAQRHGDQQIASGFGMHGGFAAAQQVHESVQEQPCPGGIQHCYDKAAPKGEGRREPRLFPVAPAQRPGDHAGSAHAEQVRYG